MTIKEKLAKIQDELFVPKDQKNSFGGYNYRSCEDILKAVKPINQRYKAVLTLDTSMEFVGTGTYIITTATLHDLESSDTISVKAYAREDDEHKGMDQPQMSGSATSYCRKYALAGLFAIDNEKDSDATNNKPREEKGSSSQFKSKYQQVSELLPRANMTPESVSRMIRNKFGKDSKVNDLNDDEFKALLESINSRIEILEGHKSEEPTNYADIPFDVGD